MSEGRGRFGAWVLVAAIVGGAAWAGAGVARRWSARQRLPDQPELWDADAALGRRASQWLASRDEKRDGSRAKSRPVPRPPEMDAAPAAVDLALVRDLCDRYGARSAQFDLPREPWHDAAKEPEACWVRDHPSAESDAVLLRLLRDRRTALAVRARAAIALARPGFAAGADAFADLVCDGTEWTIFRTSLLSRYSRFETRPPERMHDLLASPWFDLPPVAAGALLMCGDVEAPTLAVDGLVDSAKSHYSGAQAWICASGLARLVTDDVALHARLAKAAASLEEYYLGSTGEAADARRESILQLASDVRAWLAARPLLLATGFERARREYESSAQRRRELGTPPAVGVDGDDFDLAAALVGGDDPAVFGDPLARLDRVARLIRRDAGVGATPERWIDAMNDRLLTDFPGPTSELGAVMRFGTGNCMGLSSLYLAVAERLQLPIHGVLAPRHVFVRWDDGRVRRNIECTERGIEHDDRWYEARGDGLAIERREIENGSYLANLPKRSFLALAIVNRAGAKVGHREFDEALRVAEAAVRLSPREPATLTARARARAESGSARRDDVLGDLRAARAMRRPDLGEASEAVEACLRIGACDEAIRWADDGLALLPGDRGFREQRARALIRSGRASEAEADIACVAADTDDPGARTLRVEAAIVAGDDWIAALERSFPKADERESVCVDLAQAFLGEFPLREPSSADARRALACAPSITEDDAWVKDVGAAAHDVERFTKVILRHTARDVLRRRSFEIVARCCRLEGDEAGAVAADRAAASKK